MLNWGILTLGIILFAIGQIFFSLYARRYKNHVLRHGRVKFGKRYGTSWTKEDKRGVMLARIGWTIGPLIVVGLLLFFLTSLPKIGMPLYLGCILGIDGIFLVFFALTSQMGLTKQEVEISLRRRELEDGEEKK